MSFALLAVEQFVCLTHALTIFRLNSQKHPRQIETRLRKVQARERKATRTRAVATFTGKLVCQPAWSETPRQPATLHSCKYPRLHARDLNHMDCNRARFEGRCRLGT